MEDIYKLGLHGISYPDVNIQVIRVPGGWLYTRWNYSDEGIQLPNTTTFVPFDNEFQ